MKQERHSISTSEQIQIADFFLAFAAKLEALGDAEALKSLSTVVAILEPYTEKEDVTIFFDLGEYIYECGADISGSSGSETNGWRDKAHSDLLSSMEIARLLKP